MTTSNPLFSLLKRARSAGADPMRDWLILLALSVIAFVGIVAWSVWTFSVIAGDSAVHAPSPQTVSLFNHAALDNIHTIFADRAAEEGKYVTGGYRYADPSQ